MVARKRKRKKTTLLRQLLDGAAVVARTEILGLSLVLISVFTLLSLLTGSRGSVTGLWIDLLRAATGDGVAGVPLLTGILGLWMVIRAIEKMSDLPWQIPVGLLLIFLAYITAITLWLPSITRAARVSDGEAGGALGLLFANLLEAGLRFWGAWAVVAVSAALGLALLTGRWLLDLALDCRDGLREMWKERPQEGFYGNLKKTDLTPKRSAPSQRAEGEPDIVGRSDLAPGRRPPPAPTATGDAPQPAGKTGGGEEERGERENAPGRPPAPALLTPQFAGGLPAWELPRLSDMLDFWDRIIDSDDLIRYRGRLLEETLALFGVPADFEGVNAGPTVTQYLIRPGYIERTVRGETKRTKVKVSKISSLTNDLALALAARNVRIEAPIPGTSYVGIEVPNSESNNVGLKELMESDAFEKVQARGRLAIALGEDVRGKPVITDLARMPHLLIAGATGTGKSVCINSIIGCLLLTHTPETLRLLMIDPKMVELTVYNGMPHLLSPVVTEVDRASGALYWCVREMERRYQLLNKAGVRDLGRFNVQLRKQGEEILPYLVVIIDEMADLMMSAPDEVEKHIIRLAQMARAVGIHLIIATQRPSVDVITGLIKANFPARIAFAVTSQIDSRVVLDVPGAEHLLGRGDMLFMAPDSSKLERLQGAFLDDPEINRIARYWQEFHKLETYIQPQPPDVPDLIDGLSGPAQEPPGAEVEEDNGKPRATGKQRQKRLDAEGQMEQPLPDQSEGMQASDARDDLFDEAVEVVTQAGRGSATILQRKLRIGYTRASRLVEQLEAAGILGPDRGRSQGREVYPVGAEALPAEAKGSHSPKDGAGALRRIDTSKSNGPAANERTETAAQPLADEDAPPRIWM